MIDLGKILNVNAWQIGIKPGGRASSRTTRSGQVFNNVVPIAASVDLNQLFEEAEQGQKDDDDLESDVESEVESDDENAEFEPLSQPSSRTSSPLPELTDSEDNDRSGPHFERRAGETGSSKSRKSARQRKRKRAEAGNCSASSKRHQAEKVLDAETQSVPFDFDKARVTSTGWAGLRDASTAGIPALRDLVGFQLVNWDGRAPTAFTVGEEEVVVAAALGQPSDKKWKQAHTRYANKLQEARGELSFSGEERAHRRGDFEVKAHGTSFGGGQKEPRPLKHSDKNKSILDGLTRDKTMQRIAHFSSGGFRGWEPDVHDYYAKGQKKLFKWKPRLRRRLHFKKSVWMCLTINFGLRTLCRPHRDFANLSFGFCAITALGRFNPDKGGHLVLRELKLVIRFPPGSTILIPSALITHYNVEIAKDETRYSVTQYTAGAIFRFVEQGCMLDADYYGSLDAAGRKEVLRENAGRFKKGIAMLSRMRDLRQKAEAVRG